MHEFTDGLEALYRSIFELEAKVIARLEASHPTFFARYEETIADEDRTEAYKLFAVRATVEG